MNRKTMALNKGANGSITREELLRELENLRKKLESDIEIRLKTHQDELMEKLDDIVGQLSNLREESTISASLHRRVVDIEDKVENLDRIHPGGKHVSA